MGFSAAAGSKGVIRGLCVMAGTKGAPQERIIRVYTEEEARKNNNDHQRVEN